MNLQFLKKLELRCIQFPLLRLILLNKLGYLLDIIFSWVKWRTVLNRNTDSTCESSLVTSEPFSETAHQVGLWTSLNYLSLDYSWRWDGIRYLFTKPYKIGVFKNLSIRSTRLITPGDDRHPQYGSIAMPNLVEMRAR